MFALALALGITARFCALHLLDAFGFAAGMAADPMRAAVIAFNAVTVFTAATGVSALVCVVALSRTAPETAPMAAPIAVQNNALTVDDTPGASPRTDWPGIFSLIGIMIVNRVLSGMMEWRLSPYLVFMDWTNQPYVFVLVAAFILCGLFAGRSIRVFMRRFLPPAIILFIFIPCLVLFDGEKYAGFLLFMNILYAVLIHVIWVVFSAALIELYAGKYWLYGLAIVPHFTNIFLYISPPLARMIPAGTEYVV
jgi:hypothetical protein